MEFFPATPSIGEYTLCSHVSVNICMSATCNLTEISCTSCEKFGRDVEFVNLHGCRQWRRRLILLRAKKRGSLLPNEKGEYQVDAFTNTLRTGFYLWCCKQREVRGYKWQTSKFRLPKLPLLLKLFTWQLSLGFCGCVVNRHQTFEETIIISPNSQHEFNRNLVKSSTKITGRESPLICTKDT